MKALGRSRTVRSITSPVDSPQKEREPFNVGPYRPKSAPPVGNSGRRSRQNSENVPPEGSINVPEGTSPVHSKSSSKGPRSSKESLPSSPSLPPRPPRPSPARNTPALSQMQDKGVPNSHGNEQGGSTKRKINWDLPAGSSDNLSTTAAADISGADSGVKVIVRVRPLNKREESEEAAQVAHKLSPTSVCMADQQFTYDAVAGEDSSQQAVFEMVGLPMVENCLAGFNSSIFAYGQTGSGKTHTMWGVMPDSITDQFPSEDRGLTPRVFERLFARIQEEEMNNVDKQPVYQCRCSFLEIYNEQIMDLLEPSQKTLMIREDTKTGVYVDSLSEEYVSNVEDVSRLLVKGLANRRIGATTMNNESSRSHSVFTCVIESRSKSAGECVSSVRSSRMNLVDLAGSERQKQTGSAGERLKEAGNINKSLSQLGNVINILAEVAQSGKHRHIPYRDSRLTFLLQESLGGNAKLAMICAISPASSCRNETLSTLRFAQRAKAMQNKAVINEEKANDVNLLREQIRQLKDELTRMKSSDGPEPSSGGGYSNTWNARRSYNLLRLSLSHPVAFPLIQSDDNDEEMEIDDEATETEPVSTPPVDTLQDGADHSKSMDMELGSLASEKESKKSMASSSQGPEPRALAAETDLDDTPNIESPTLGLLENAKKNLPALAVTAVSEVAPLHSPTHSHSPKAKEEKKKDGPVFGLPPLAENEIGPDFAMAPFKEKAGSSLYSTNSLPTPSSRDRLAASLQKGLQILDNHQKSSLATVRRSVGVRFSFQSTESKTTRTTERGVQTVPTLCPTCNCSTSTADRSPEGSHSNKKARTMEMGIQTSPPKVLTTSAEWSNLMEIGVNTALPDSPDKSNWQIIASNGNEGMVVTPTRPDYAQAIEALLAGSIRRERAAEEAMTQQAAEIEQINRLVRQYKHERECNSVLQQSREDKIARLEALMGGVLPCDAFLTEEWAALLHEHKTLQEKFDKHPEVTHAKVEQERLLDELERYRTFFDLGEREVLVQENMQLRNHLQTYIECGTTGAAKHRRLSRAIRESTADLALQNLPEDVAAGVLPLTSREPVDFDRWEKERKLWEERQIESLSMMEEMDAESTKYRQLAEMRKLELDGEKRCAKEVHEALEMAMEGHARLLEQYAELQEKHIALLGKNRKIREGVKDLKKLAKKAGVTAMETRWFESQAEQLVAMRIDHELERDSARDEVEGLQAQLRDTAEAVAAAGELVVRLKEAEDAVCMAQDAAAMAGQEANGIRRDMEKLTRRHATEMATLQQRLLESRLEKAQLCPMCVMAERVKFEFTEVDAETAQAELEAETRAKSSKHVRAMSSPGILGVGSSWNGEGFAREEEEESVAGELEDRGNFLENLDIDEFVDEAL